MQLIKQGKEKQKLGDWVTGSVILKLQEPTGELEFVVELIPTVSVGSDWVNG